jgi:membrane associated rhomboid family serine protease
MGVENRDYYRGQSSYSGSGEGWGFETMGPAVKFLIIANIVVFLAQIFVTRPMQPADMRAMFERQGEHSRRLTPEQAQEISMQMEAAVGGQRVSIPQQWLQLDTPKVLHGQVWRLLTYAFCHDRTSIWHIVFNMAGLFWFGTTLESMYGSREFTLFYLAAAVISGLANVLINVYTGSTIPAVGASGAVMAVLMLFTIHYPRYTIHVFWVIPIEMRWLVVLYVLFDLHPVLLALAGDQGFSGIAHAAHLGGLAFGFLYWRFNLNLQRYADLFTWNRKRWRFRRPALRVYKESAGPPRARANPLEDQVDAILQKIHEQGQDSLTDYERLALQRAGERYRDQNRT